MSKQFLNNPNVRSVLNKKGRSGMAQRVRSHPAFEASFSAVIRNLYLTE
jgi:hypothetical protein